MKRAYCESCGSEYPMARMRRLVWALVCLECEEKLRSRRRSLSVRGRRRASVEPAETAGLPEADASPTSLLAAVSSAVMGMRGHLGIILLYGGAVLMAQFGGEATSGAVGGAMSAELITWAIFSLIRAPFEGIQFLISLVLRLVALIVVQGPGLPFLSEGSGLQPGAITFFSVLILRAIWFGCWWNGLTRDDEHCLDEVL